MLARANRVVTADDFRATMRRGKRVGTPHAVVYLRARAVGEPTRFGFIVAKTVGNAVTRNLVRRRLRSVGREFLTRSSRQTDVPGREHGGTHFGDTGRAAAGVAGTDIVIRALPGLSEVNWAILHDEIFTGVERGVSRQ